MENAGGNSAGASSPSSSSSSVSGAVTELGLSALATGAVLTLCLTGHISGTEALAALATGLAVPADLLGAVKRLLGAGGKQ